MSHCDTCGGLGVAGPWSCCHASGKPSSSCLVQHRKVLLRFETPSVHQLLSLELNFRRGLLRLLATAVQDQLALASPQPVPHTAVADSGQ